MLQELVFMIFAAAEFNPKVLNPSDYTPVGDIMVLSLCMVFGVILILSKVQKSSSYKIMLMMIGSLMLAAASSLFYRVIMTGSLDDPTMLYITRILDHTFLSFVQVTYVLYLREPLWMKNEGYNRFIAAILVIAICPIIIDVLGILFRFGFYVNSGVIYSEFTVYPFAYMAFELIIFYLIIRYRSRIIKQIYYCLISVNALSVVLTAMQGMFNQSSYNTFVYFIPAIGLLFMFHSNPYDQETGAANDKFFVQEVTSCIEKNIPLIMICCKITDFSNKIQQMAELKKEFMRFFKQNIKRGVLFRFSDGRLVLTLRKTKRENCERTVSKMLEDFYGVHEYLNLDYKLIVAETVPEIGTAAEYIALFDFIDGEMGYNETRKVSESDIQRFLGSNYILSELEDIAKKRDLDDERVLVYCQPVFNILTGTYDTAEALMRLKLPETGLVFPDKFIPVAERNGLIHQLSLIILNKTCRMIHDLIAEDYILNRISVNFSTLDMKNELFCDEVQDIIIRNDIPYDKVAIEITESRSEGEFNQMKQKVMDLQGLGIKFYLDDFGTGYSNFERIMEIPFDIIKFDRSMLIESVKNDSSKYMVTTFAGMFNDLNYSVLFEGVEDDRDEQQCRNMYAKYLQGYKYSKPIPIGDLRNFLEKAV